MRRVGRRVVRRAVHLAARLAVVAVGCCVASPSLALHDPGPDDALAVVQGEWVGTLVYRDDRRPDRTVTLPTRLFATMGAPDTLVLHDVFDDGPGKTVYSSESMRFDFAKAALAWTTGTTERDVGTHRIVSVDRKPTSTRVVFESTATDGGTIRQTLELEPRRVVLRKEEIDATGASLLRNTFRFGRVAPTVAP